MLKRILCLGVIVLLSLSLSLSALAASQSTVSLGFPFFSNLWLRLGSGGTFTTLYDGSNGRSPISGISVTPSTVQTSGSSYNISLRMGGTYSISNITESSYSLTYLVPRYTGFHTNTYSNSNPVVISQGTLYAPDQDDDQEIYLYSNANYEFEYTVDASTVSFPAKTENITITNNDITGGDYLITGYFQYPADTLDDLFDLFTGSASCYIWVGSQQTGTIVDISDLRFSMDNSSGQTVSFSAVINVPATFQNVSRINLIIYTKSGVSAPLSRFGVSTGGFEYNDTVTGIAGLSSELSGWFSGLKSGVGSISSLLRNQDYEAEEATKQAARSELETASSHISEIHQFEADMSSNIAQSVQTIDFSLPSGSGFLSAMACVQYIFGMIFNSIGIYQYIITIPLILGILLLLVGRSSETVGHLYDAFKHGL